MADVLSRLPFARSSVMETDLSSEVCINEQTTRNTKEYGCTGSSSEAIQPGSSASGDEITVLKLISDLLPTVGDSVATAITDVSSAVFKDCCSELGSTSKPCGTIALQAVISAPLFDSSFLLGKNQTVASSANCRDYRQSAQNDSYYTVLAVSDIRCRWPFDLLHGFSAVHTKIQIVSDSTAEEILLATNHTDKGSLIQPIQQQSEKTSTIVNI